jgi:antitoxin component YwqK of YwqJK toxin-antitoxin module
MRIFISKVTLCFAFIGCGDFSGGPSEFPNDIDLDDNETLSRICSIAVESNKLSLLVKDEKSIKDEMSGMPYLFDPGELNSYSNGYLYTGWTKDISSRNKLKKLTYYEDGKETFRIEWYENGKKKLEMESKLLSLVIENTSSGSSSFIWTTKTWYNNGRIRSRKAGVKGLKFNVESSNKKIGSGFTPPPPGWSWYPKLNEYSDDFKIVSAEIWMADGHKCTESNFNKETGNGLVVWYGDNGQKLKQKNFKHKLLDGISTSWHANGEKHFEINWKEGQKHGLSREWNNNGELFFEETYYMGKCTKSRGPLSLPSSMKKKYNPTKRFQTPPSDNSTIGQ